MYAPLDPKLKKMHDETNKRLKDIEKKYPKAGTDAFQKSCIIWELFYGGKSLCIIDCNNRDVQKTINAFTEIFGPFSGFEAGISTQAVAKSPDGPATGFQVTYYENKKDDIRAKLNSIGISESEMRWIPESELREKFEAWKKQQGKYRKTADSRKKREQRMNKPDSQKCRSHDNDLFELVVEETKAHPAFNAMQNLAHHSGARKIMNDLYARMRDPNGNFKSDFQSYGFHARVFELACYGYLESHGFSIDRSYPSPDFLISTVKNKVAIEAVSASPSVGLNTDISLAGIDAKLPFEELFDKTTNEFPIRMGNIMLKKLQKRYWALPHCQNIPLVLFVSPFYESGSILHIDDSLARYLYGGWDVLPYWVKYKGIFTRVVPIEYHRYEGRELKSNFFSQPSCEYVSAVIYSNSFTEQKFVRMAIQMGLETNFEAIRKGACLIRNEDGEISCQDFQYRVNDQSAPVETWFQGITIFHNPNALIPLPDGLFKATNIYQLRNGNLIRTPSDFHPLESFTIISPK